MYDFWELIKERAEISKRELILGIASGFLLGLVLGLLIGGNKNKPPKSRKKIVINVPEDEKKSITLNPEDYD